MREPMDGRCAYTERTRELIEDQLSGHERQELHAHLQRCEACRTAFHDATAERLPHVPHYTFLERIGRGGFGQVYKAIHHTTTRAEAVKVLSRLSHRRLDYFANEVQLVARLRHPNIVTLYEAHLDAAPPHYSMELVDGRHLGDYLERHKLTIEQRIRIVITIAQALDYAHQQGVIHRDIKPQNVLMDSDGQPHVVDFGVAKWIESEAAELENLNRSEGVVGTRGYIAPEIYRREKTDTRADLYSLGALLHYVVLGECPAGDHSEDQIATQLKTNQVERPLDLAAIIACCLSDQPQDRYATSGDLAGDLECYCRGQAVHARRDTTWLYRAARVSAVVLSRSPGLVIGILALLAAIGLSLLFEGGRLRRYVPGDHGSPVALIGLVPSTLSAIMHHDLGPGLEAVEFPKRKSWRRMYGAVMKRLAEVNPRVVVWDYYFPDCHTEHDPALLDGILALDAPVVFAVRNVAPDGTPAICPVIEEAIAAYGSAIMTWTQPDVWGEMDIVVGMQRGFNEWVPSLSVAAYAAARHPYAQAHLHETEQELQIRYRRPATRDGSYPWLEDYDTINLSGALQITPEHIHGAATDADGALQTQDRYRLTRIDAGRARVDPNCVIPMEKVLHADTAQLAAWFDDRPVIIGQMIPGFDQYTFADRTPVFGVEVHAAAIQALLSRASVIPERPAAIRFRTALASFITAALASLLPLGIRLRTRVWTAIAALTVVLGIGLAWLSTRQALSVGWIQLVIPLATLLCVGGPVLLVRALSHRQMKDLAGADTHASSEESRTILLGSDQRASSSATAGQ
jgi:hypothetical protein